MAEWTDTRIEDDLRAVLRREVDALPVTVTPHDVVARRRARRRIRRPWLALMAAALLMLPIVLAAGASVLAPADESPYVVVLARGLVPVGVGTDHEHVSDLELVLVHRDGTEATTAQVSASRFAGYRSTREYALSPDGRWLALALYTVASADEYPAIALAILDMHDTTRTKLVTGGRLKPVWGADGTLWWSVKGRLQRVDIATGGLVTDVDSPAGPTVRPPAIADHLDEIDESGNWPYGSGGWEIVSMDWAADGGTWLLVRQDPWTSNTYRLLHRAPTGAEAWSPEFPGPTSIGMPYDVLRMAPDDSLATIGDKDYKSVRGELSPGRTQIVDVGTGQPATHTGWLVGFVRADAAAEWAGTEGGSR